MELLKELFILFGRIITILPLMLVMTLIMGKRSIAELPVFDFLVIVILGAVVGADIADPEIKHIHTGVAITVIGIFHVIVSKLKIRYRKFGHVITFEPTIVIQEGKLIVKNLKRLRYSIDNILQMLREKEVFDINDVHLGIIESNGRISILKKDSKAGVTLEDMNLNKRSASIAYPIIIDGEVCKKTLTELNLSDGWLHQQLSSIGVKSEREVFFASVNNKNEFHASLKGSEGNEKIMPIYH